MPITMDQYKKWYQQSINEPELFWGEQAATLIHWQKPWDTVLTGDFSNGSSRWFSGGQLNAAYNCLDRHLATRATQPAIIWEGDDPSESITLTYQTLHERVCRLANVLKQRGIKRGDRVCIYLPMIPEAAMAMLACARIGAVHSVVFGGFSAESLRSRILDADCRLVITANEGLRGGKVVSLKRNVDAALSDAHNVHTVLVVKRTETVDSFNSPRDVWYHEAMQTVNADCEVEAMEANDPLFILYTSGSTGKPKGILHGTGGYLVYAAMTHRYIFDYQAPEIFWCTADVGWITGHTYGVYGPLANGATVVMFEGVPNYPTPSRCWEIIDRYHVTIFYTAPTAIRALRREGDTWVTKTSRKSLRVLGSVGEPINPEAWQWYFDVVGEGRCPIVDTWWQTETGGIMISALPFLTPLKAGSAAWPFFGVAPAIVDDHQQPITDHSMGQLVITNPWPGMMQTIYGDNQRFINQYFKEVPGCYLTGDQAHCDQDNDYWISGRSDDVIKVSGHRIGTGEVESAMIMHEAVSEAAAVAIPDDIKGQAICVYVSLKQGYHFDERLITELKNTVTIEIGAIAVPKTIIFAEGLPKTRSGKIMRRLLRKIASGETHDLGDLSTLADPSVVDQLMNSK